MDLLIQYWDINKEYYWINAGIKGVGSNITSNACGYVLVLLGENQHIQARAMQEQQDIFGDDILRPVRRDDLPMMVYFEQGGRCLLCSNLFSRTVVIFLHDIN
jgi:hypothetical protein